jgi:hypothetical protein
MRTARSASHFVVLATACVVTLGAASPLLALQPGAEREQALRLFSERVESYAALHRRLEGPLPPLTPTTQPLANLRARERLAGALREARSTAKQGDIFAPAIAAVLRGLIADALKGRDVEALLNEIMEEHPGIAWAPVVVNEPLPKGAPHEVPCVLLQALPILPEDVEYRIVGHSLVLWDIHANLVVDVLPDAFSPVRTSSRM